MKITYLRENGKKIDRIERELLSTMLEHELGRAGFITEVTDLSKIGLHMKSFIVNTDMLGYNKRVDHMYCNSLVGFKKTQIPTWDQRVEFNNIINNFFDRHDLVGKIVSGVFLVRCRTVGAKDQYDWEIIAARNIQHHSISALTDADVRNAALIRQQHARKKRQQDRSQDTSLLRSV